MLDTLSAVDPDREPGDRNPLVSVAGSWLEEHVVIIFLRSVQSFSSRCKLGCESMPKRSIIIREEYGWNTHSAFAESRHYAEIGSSTAFYCSTRQFFKCRTHILNGVLVLDRL